MSIPWVDGAGEGANLAVVDVELAQASVDPVHRRALDDDVVDLDALRVADLDPVLGAADGQVPERDVVGRDEDPAA